eukprot:scaffold2_cov119-Cylindrotheca_fusiformis.AAC.1
MSALYFDGRLLEPEDPSPRVNVRQFTKLVQNHKSKMVHFEGSTRNNSPDSGKNQRARRSISKGRRATIHQFDCRLLEQEDPSPRVDFDGRLLEQEDPSPMVDVRQFTRFGQNRKSKEIHLHGFPRSNPPQIWKYHKTKRSISKGPCPTIHQIGAKSQDFQRKKFLLEGSMHDNSPDHVGKSECTSNPTDQSLELQTSQDHFIINNTAGPLAA